MGAAAGAAGLAKKPPVVSHKANARPSKPTWMTSPQPCLTPCSHEAAQPSFARVSNHHHLDNPPRGVSRLVSIDLPLDIRHHRIAALTMARHHAAAAAGILKAHVHLLSALHVDHRVGPMGLSWSRMNRSTSPIHLEQLNRDKMIFCTWTARGVCVMVLHCDGPVRVSDGGLTW